jgi:vacuolar protein sorting-associated protein 26
LLHFANTPTPVFPHLLYSSLPKKNKQVHNIASEPEINSTIKMEVGIEDFLHIEFEYNRSKYHLKDSIIGKVYFLLIRIPVKYMELSLIRKESTGTGETKRRWPGRKHE